MHYRRLAAAAFCCALVSSARTGAVFAEPSHSERFADLERGSGPELKTGQFVAMAYLRVTRRKYEYSSDPLSDYRSTSSLKGACEVGPTSSCGDVFVGMRVGGVRVIFNESAMFDAVYEAISVHNTYAEAEAAAARTKTTSARARQKSEPIPDLNSPPPPVPSNFSKYGTGNAAIRASRPSDRDVASQVFPSLMADPAWRRLLKVDNLRRIDGYETQTNLYLVQFQYDLTFLLSCGPWAIAATRGAARVNRDTPLVPLVFEGLQLGAAVLLITHWGNFQRGDVFKMLGSAEFRRSERGWTMTRGSEDVSEAAYAEEPPLRDPKSCLSYMPGRQNQVAAPRSQTPFPSQPWIPFHEKTKTPVATTALDYCPEIRVFTTSVADAYAGPQDGATVVTEVAPYTGELTCGKVVSDGRYFESSLNYFNNKGVFQPEPHAKVYFRMTDIAPVTGAQFASWQLNHKPPSTK